MNNWKFKYIALKMIYKLKKSCSQYSFVLRTFSDQVHNLSVSEMNVLKKLDGLNQNKPYHGFANLSVGYHGVVRFRIVKNKYGNVGEGSGKSILVELDNQVLFLPQYFWQTISESDISDLNSLINGGENVYLFFGGKPKGDG